MIFRLGFKNILGAHWPFISVAALFVLTAIYYLPFYKYQVNPDATSYISIAQKYADLDYKHAVNGYWGPLLSWLLVPFIWLHIEPLMAARIIALASSVGLLYVYWFLLRRYFVDKIMSWLSLLGLAGILMTWSLGAITPDVLFAFLLTAEIAFLDRAARRANWQNSIALGLSVALLYFCKAFGLYLFLAQLAVIAISIGLAKQGFGRVARLSVRSLIIVLILISPFVAAISVKYHHLTISTSGAYNYGTLAPETNGVPVHPTTVSGPYEPPNPTAFSAWEDPSFLPVVEWSIYGSVANFNYYLTLIYNNFIQSRDAIVSFGSVVAVGFAVLIAYFIIGFGKSDKLPFYISLSAILLVIGYCLIFVEYRYLWPVVPLALLGVVFLYRDQLKPSGFLYLVASVIVFVSLWSNFQNLNKDKHIGQNIFDGAQTLKPYLDSSSHVAGDFSFNASLYACYFAHAQCYGLFSADSANLADDFKKYQIHYLLIAPQTASELEAKGFRLTEQQGANYLDRHLYFVKV